MKIKRKTMGRSEWRGLRAARLVTDVDPETGWRVGLLTIEAVDEPLIVGDPPITVMDTGMRWLELAPPDEPWFATVMFTPEGELAEHYFDMNKGNHFEKDGTVWFEDLFLDVIWRPGELPTLADEMELAQAIPDGLLSKEEAVSVLYAARELIRMLIRQGAEFDALCRRWHDRLLAR